MQQENSYPSGPAALYAAHLQGRMTFSVEFSEPGKTALKYCGLDRTQAERISEHVFGRVIGLAERLGTPLDLTCAFDTVNIHIWSEIVLAEGLPC
jgi:hypothetical protein